MRRERLFLEDIITAVDTIMEFTRHCDLNSFQSNKMLQSAVLHQLMIIGEAVAHLSPELRARYPEIPWADIKAFRNIIVHDYFGIDWEEAWRSATTRVPMLRSPIAAILRSEFPE